MLSLSLLTDKKKIADLYSALAFDDAAYGVVFAFWDDGKPIGFCRQQIGDCAVIDKVFFVDGVELGDKEFFVRSVFFKYQTASVTLEVVGVHPELEDFGFVNVDGNMRIWSQDIDLHGSCKGRAAVTAEERATAREARKSVRSEERSARRAEKRGKTTK